MQPNTYMCGRHTVGISSQARNFLSRFQNGTVESTQTTTLGLQRTDGWGVTVLYCSADKVSCH